MEFMDFFTFLIFYLYSFVNCDYLNQNNTEITLEIDCIEIIDDDSNFFLEIDLCVSYKKENSLESTKCDIFSSKYRVNFQSGMCLNGIWDSREQLKEKIKFNIKWEDFYVIIKISTVNNKKQIVYFDSLVASMKPSFSIVNIEMDPFFSDSKNCFEIKFNVNSKCVLNYYGTRCENYCVDIPNFFKCNNNGSRKCMQGISGQGYCNIKKECEYNAICSFQNNTRDIVGYVHESIPCNPTLSDCNNKKCQLNLITLDKSCIDEPIYNKTEPRSLSLHLNIVMSLSVLGGIIVLLLVIILFLAVYKGRRRRPENNLPHSPRRHIPLPIIRNVSIIDDYAPPSSNYADMCSQCLSDTSNSSATYNSHLSLPLRIPNDRLCH